MKKINYIIAGIILIMTSVSCEKALEISPKDQFAPGNVLTNQAGIKALLYSSYSAIQSPSNYRYSLNFAEVTTDIGYNTGGAENLIYTQLINFTWDPSIGSFDGILWTPYYRAVRDANLVLENIDNVADATDQIKQSFTAEARFLRAYSYAELYNSFGPVPLTTSSTQDIYLPRATDEEIKTFIEAELNASITDLPEPGKEELYGRATKGSALGTLAKFLLNTKQWQKAADASKKVMDLNYYALYPVFKDMFKIENEKNKEMIWVVSCTSAATNRGNWFQCGAMPTGFLYTNQLPEYKWTSNVQNFATKYKLRDAFINTFNPSDKRFELVVRTYVNVNNVTVDLTKTPNSTASLKYFDNNGLKNEMGNDIPLIRFADILLSRAEALNELNGVNQESINLLNQVRTRAGIPLFNMSDVASPQAFKDMILRERGWEFISEGKRREDIIRHGKFVSLAHARGAVNAKPEHARYPIPQGEVDANPLMVQNPGY